MTQYINKSILVAEIEKRIKEIDEIGTYLSSKGILTNLLCHINTLEVKEVDLEKEVENWVKTGPHTSYPWCTIPDAIRITAEYFFELGLKAQGE